MLHAVIRVLSTALVLALVFALPIGPISGPSTAEASPTKRLLGAWAGRGTARFEGNRRERIKCNAYYTGGGSKLNIAVRCASVSYKIEIRSKLAHSGGRVSGTWEERTFNASGATSGSLSDDRLRLNVEGGGLTASMAIDFSESKQKIKISTAGVTLKSVAINLARSRSN